MKQDFEKAEEHFKEAIELNPESINLLRDRGKWLFDQEKYEQATKDLKLAN